MTLCISTIISDKLHKEMSRSNITTISFTTLTSIRHHFCWTANI